jgi:tetratricopeptide (TPR) repeat protein
VVAVVVIGGITLLSHAQVAVWQNSGTLWRDCLVKTKNNATAYCNLGFYYRTTGETNRAIDCYQKAFQLRPDMFEINLNLGAVLLESGRPAEATNYYRRALVPFPDLPLVNLDLGVAELRAGDFNAAAVQLKRAAELNPGQSRPWFLQGMALAELNQTAAAIDCYQRALALEPASAKVSYYLGIAWLKLGKYDDAIASLNQAVNHQPGWDDASYQLARAYLKRGEPGPAADAWRQVLAVNPFHLPALNGLAWLLATSPDPKLRNGAQAVELARRACDQTTYTNIDYVSTLAAAYAEAGRMDDAVASAREACAAARLTGQPGLLAKNQRYLKLYEAGRPCRENGNPEASEGE